MSAEKRHKIVLVVVGPTGVGKTRLSKLLAEQLPVEIVSADSRQIYRYMDIGTAKPSPELLKRIPHHFINILNPDQYYSAGEYGQQARRVIEEIFARERVPLVVGGSGLYIRALLEGFFQHDVRNEKIRESLEHRLREEGSQSLYRDLQKVDPVSAGRIHPNNSQRIIRALEVYLAGGVPLSRLQEKKLPPPDFTPLKFGLTRERKKLYQDINRRVEEMFRRGLIQEVSRILGMGYEKNLNSLNSVGYREVIAYLEGEIDYETCVELVKRNTRRYAKRQYTWFRADPEIRWLEVEREEDFTRAAQEIVDAYRKAMEL